MENKLAIIQAQETIDELNKVKAAITPLITEFKGLITITDAVSQGLMKAGVKDFANETAKLESLLKKINSLDEKRIALESKLSNLASKQARETANVSKANQQLNKEMVSQIRLKEAQDRANAREQRQLEKTQGLYAKMEIKLKSLQLVYRDLAAKKEAGIKLTDREALSYERYGKRIKQYDEALKSVDASMGKHQRNVGNYKKGFNEMSNAVNQLTREAPAFAWNLQTGFMAISNNIPILVDAFNNAKIKNQELTASGQKAVPVWKQFASALFSWQTILSVGITLLTVYGDKIVKYIDNLFTGNNVLKNTNQLLKEHQDIVSNTNTEYADQLTTYTQLRLQWINSAGDLKTRNEFLRESKDEFAKLGVEIDSVSEAEDFLIKNTANVVKALSLRARAAAFSDIAKEEQKKAIEGEQETQRALEERQKARGNFWAESWARLKEKFGDSPTLDYLDNENKSLRATEQTVKLLNEANKLIEPYKPKEKTDKPKKDKPSSLTANQKDFIAEQQAVRDEAIVVQQKKLRESKITEEDYWKEYIKIIQKYRDAISDYLNGKNAKERQIEASVKRKAWNEILSSDKEIYDLQIKNLNAYHKTRKEEIDTEESEITNNQFISEQERLKLLFENNKKQEDENTRHYKELIDLAKSLHQSTFEIEAEALQKSEELTQKRISLQSKWQKAYEDDVKYMTEFNELLIEKNSAEAESLIIGNKRLTQDEKDYELKQNQLTKQKELNDARIKEIQQLQLVAKAKMLANVPLTKDEAKSLASGNTEVAKLNASNSEIDKQKAENKNDEELRKLSSFKEGASSLLSTLGLDNAAQQFTDTFDSIYSAVINKTVTFREAMAESAKLIGAVMNDIISQQTEERIAMIDAEIERTRNLTDQEIEFVNDRLNTINAIQEKTQEQIDERNALEDEARTLRLQQEYREKILEAQKAKAQQKASAQQAIINGLVGASMAIAKDPTPKGYIQAAIAAGFGALQAALIMSKNPVPQYFTGTQNALGGFAFTQERGAEIITDKNDNIKSLGSNRGAQLTLMEKGDKVYTASETSSIIKNTDKLPKVGNKLFNGIGISDFKAPIIINKGVDIDELAEKVGKKFEKTFAKFDKTNIYELDGFVYMEKDGKLPVIVGKSKNRRK